jgi:dTDP-4-dehydrorhamnose reductase|tara:strand:+ start:8951 stop:9811 length:861 start_codon:yes stop_codon:yes gene_type:complete
MKRILVTGGSGLLGVKLVSVLKNLGFIVVSHGRSSGVDVICDLTFQSETQDMLDTVEPDVIINLAALTDVDQCERTPDRAYFSNTKIVGNISKWVKEHEGCYLLQISTDQVYNSVGPHVEMDHILSNYYAFSKYAGELLALQASGGVLRTNFFGKSLLNSRASMSDWVLKNLRSNTPIAVFTDVMFSPLSINTLCKMIILMIKKRQAGLFNLGSSEGMSKADFAFKLAENFGFNGSNMTREKSESKNLFAYRPKDMRMDSSLFESVFKIKLPTLAQEIVNLRSDYD